MVGSGQMLAELSLHRWEHKMAALIAYTLACAAWLRLTTRRPGLGAKLTATAPVLILNAIAPLLFHRYSEPVTLAFSVFLLTWLGERHGASSPGTAAASPPGRARCCSWREGLTLPAAAPLHAGSFKAVAAAGSRGEQRHITRDAARAPPCMPCPPPRGPPPILPVLPAPHTAPAPRTAAGPLAQQPWSLLQFWVLYLLPIVPAAPPSASGGPRRRPRKQHHESPGTGAQMFARWAQRAGRRLACKAGRQAWPGGQLHLTGNTSQIRGLAALPGPCPSLQRPSASPPLPCS